MSLATQFVVSPSYVVGVLGPNHGSNVAQNLIVRGIARKYGPTLDDARELILEVHGAKASGAYDLDVDGSLRRADIEAIAVEIVAFGDVTGMKSVWRLVARIEQYLAHRGLSVQVHGGLTVASPAYEKRWRPSMAPNWLASRVPVVSFPRLPNRVRRMELMNRRSHWVLTHDDEAIVQDRDDESQLARFDEVRAVHVLAAHARVQGLVLTTQH